MWELGAIWSRGIEMKPLRFEPITPASLPELLRHRQVKPFGEHALNAVATAVTRQMKVDLNLDVWTNARDALISLAPRLLNDLEDAWKATPAAQQRLQARFGAAMPLLHATLGRIRDSGYAMLLSSTDVPDRTFQLTLKEAARSMAELFKATTGVPVRITLKQVILIGYDDAGVSILGVEDIVRDRAALRKGRDRVDENTDFHRIVYLKEDRFFCNDLQELLDAGTYRNSHVTQDDELKYRSTVVWPIRKLHDTRDDEVGYEISDGQDLVAFLCVDSAGPGAFSEYDVELGAGLAAALYPVLRPYLFEEDPE